ncbi:Uncharacterised protein [uncultured archaeon]|nr:Uncharacterised protein [uncultured archaeon]
MTEDSTNAKKKLLNHFGISTEGNDFWKRVPFSDKSHLDNFIPSSKFAYLFTTGGSTGESSLVFTGKESMEAQLTTACLTFDYFGVTEKDNVAMLLSLKTRSFQLFTEACVKRGTGVIPLGAWNSSPISQTVRIIEKVRPTVWEGISSYLLSVMCKVKPEYLPRCIITGAEPTLNWQIRKCKELGVKMYTRYSTAEGGQCGASKYDDPNRMDVIGNSTYVETVEKSMGDAIVVTDLNNFVMPIIRFVPGDIVKNVKYNDDDSVKEFTYDKRMDDEVKINGCAYSKADIISRLGTCTQDFAFRIKNAGKLDVIEITTTEEHKSEEEAILRSVDDIGAEKSVVFGDAASLPKTSNGKRKYVIDMRGIQSVPATAPQK